MLKKIADRASHMMYSIFLKKKKSKLSFGRGNVEIHMVAPYGYFTTHVYGALNMLGETAISL